MRKSLGLLFAGLLLTTVASANSIFLSCGGTTSANGTGAPLIPQPYNIVCPTLTLPTGEGLYSIQVFAYDSFNQADFFDYPGGTSIQYSYAGLYSGLGLPSGYVDTVTGQSTASAYYQLGNTITSGFDTWTGAVGNVSTSLTAGGFQGALDPSGNGQASVNFFITYDYGLVPEPVTMFLVGGGLLGLGLLANKRHKTA
jgi:hypothetical protein